MRVAILGNSGSGKSTLATWLSTRSGAAQLDLDSMAWLPGQIAAARAAQEAQADVDSFCVTHERWIVEGCYTSLIERALAFRPLLLFLNPGAARCLANCQARPWEPHKYRSRAEQDGRLAGLLAWVLGYYSREGELSLQAHRSCFEAYTGPKVQVTDTPALEPPSPSVLSWLV